jgi:hypothetical protein
MKLQSAQLDKVTTWRRLYHGNQKPNATEKSQQKRVLVAAEREELIMNKEIESIYTLLVRSEDRSRNTMEVGGFSLIALSVLVAVWQFANQPISLPPDRVKAVDEPSMVAIAS